MFPGRDNLTEEERRQWQEFVGEAEGDVDSSETGDESERDPTHECQACGEEVAEQTPFSRLELWCANCDGMRWFKRV